MYSATFTPTALPKNCGPTGRAYRAKRWDVPPLHLWNAAGSGWGQGLFVITTNVDAQFEKAGFSHDRVFDTQGDYGFLQCARGCHEKLYRNKGIVKEMLENTVDCRIPPGLVPRCPVCGGDMSVHVRKDGSFVENASWREKNARYSAYAKKIMDGPAVLLELGVGYNTPENTLSFRADDIPDY